MRHDSRCQRATRVGARAGRRRRVDAAAAARRYGGAAAISPRAVVARWPRGDGGASARGPQLAQQSAVARVARRRALGAGAAVGRACGSTEPLGQRRGLWPLRRRAGRPRGAAAKRGPRLSLSRGPILRRAPRVGALRVRLGAAGPPRAPRVPGPAPRAVAVRELGAADARGRRRGAAPVSAIRVGCRVRGVAYCLRLRLRLAWQGVAFSKRRTARDGLPRNGGVPARRPRVPPALHALAPGAAVGAGWLFCARGVLDLPTAPLA
mmetsp:Transcript_3810/g.11761  ORF Transcript_3810/g.11761 Transcript_3810/m.11761 type:complete len:265 (-) Transcript_3810:945-1739(-)